jgi:hypothetical protein
MSTNASTIALSELRSGQVVIQHLHLLVLADRGEFCGGNNELCAERHCEAQGAGWGGDPNASNESEVLNPFGERFRNENGDVAFHEAQIVLQFLIPRIAPHLGVLRLPYDHSAPVAAAVIDAMDDVRAIDALGYRLDAVAGEARSD